MQFVDVNLAWRENEDCYRDSKSPLGRPSSTAAQLRFGLDVTRSRISRPRENRPEMAGVAPHPGLIAESTCKIFDGLITTP
jgi:hypothetical protein